MRRKVPPCHDGTQNGTCERAIQPVHWAAMSDYAARIRAARAYAGLKQDELAERLGVDTNTIKRREGGTQHPKRGELLAIAAITGVPVSFMEHGFGETSESEVIRRLGHIEALLNAVAPDADNLQNLRTYARDQISALASGEDGVESDATTPAQDPGPPPADTSPPRAQAQRRS